MERHEAPPCYSAAEPSTVRLTPFWTHAPFLSLLGTESIVSPPVASGVDTPRFRPEATQTMPPLGIAASRCRNGVEFLDAVWEWHRSTRRLHSEEYMLYGVFGMVLAGCWQGVALTVCLAPGCR